MMSKAKATLGGLLDHNNTKTTTTAARSSHTVGGDQNVTNIERGEIYIRPDGKKVRKIKKTIVRPKQKVQQNGDSGNNNNDNGNIISETSEVYIRADGKKVRRIKRTKTVSPGTLSNSSSNQSVATAPAVSNSDETSEIYIRPDGKKVRRIRKTVPRSPSMQSTTSAATATTLDTSSTTAHTNSSSTTGLKGFLHNHSPLNKGSKKGFAAATVAGDQVGEHHLGEGIYINKDGKKVRRVQRTVTRRNTDGSDHDGGGGDGESVVYINKDGKKVRRVRKVKTAGSAASVGGGGGSSIATGSVGDIYIRPDGKKVRRVPRSSSSLTRVGGSGDGGGPASVAATSSSSTTPAATTNKLQSFLNNDSSSAAATPSPRFGAAATVAGDQVGPRHMTTSLGLTQKILNERASASAAASASATVVSSSDDGMSTATPGSAPKEGEVYINKDGKKVRRVRRRQKKLVLEDAGAHRPGGSGAATVAGDGLRHDDGEIYVRPDGKRVRRIRRTRSGSGASSVDGGSGSGSGSDVFYDANADNSDDGDKNNGKKSLGGFLSKGNNAPSSGHRMGAATVAGGNPIDGEIIIRPDGKKVIRRLKSGSLSGGSSSDGTGGEIYRRADGKLVRRVRRAGSTRAAVAAAAAKKEETTKTDETTKTNVTDETAKTGTTTTTTNESTFQEQQQHKEKEKPSSATSGTILLTAAEELIAADYRKMKRMGLPDEAVRHKMTISNVEAKIIAAVMGDEWKEDTASPAFKPSAAEEKPSIQLSSEEEAVAADYRKMLEMGLPEGAVRHKMDASSVHPKIVAAVMGEEWAEEIAPTPSKPSIQLTSEEENTVDIYRKMLRMGLPDGAVRHKMITSETSPKVIAAVFDEEWTEPETSSESPVKSSCVQLNSDEETEAVEYRRMLSMGLPVDAVRHKMIVSEVHPKIIAAVLGEEWTEDESRDGTASGAKALSQAEEEIAAQYRRMQRMGLPDDAVRHKMVMNEVDPKIIATVFGEKSSAQPVSPVSSDTLSAEEEAIAAQYRKMQRMGLPGDAVRHKMIVNEVDPRIIAAVFKDNRSEANPAQLTPAGESRAPDGVAYVVVVGDEPMGDNAKSSSEDAFIGSMDPNEKFAVKVTDTSDPNSPTKKTKFFTLSEIAKMSGQNKEELESAVAEKRKRGASPPRFSLQPLEEKKYEVTMPMNSGQNSATPTSGSENVKEVKDGQEVVDSNVAQAARAVTALGEGDMSSLLEKLQAGDMKDLLTKLQEAEKRQKKLEKQLAQSGIAIAEDIEYQEAKGKVEQIAKRMNEIGGSDVTVADKEEQNRLREEYFKLEQEMERYNTALMMTEEYQAEQDRVEKKWEDDNEAANLEALKKLRRHMPVNIRHLSEAKLTSTPSPNGKYLPKATAKKFKRTNVLQCLRINPDDLESMHPATLENMRVTGLTLTERRALYLHFKPIGPKWEKNKAEKMTERKWTWYQMMKNNFKEALAPYLRHIEQYGPPENHPYATRDNPNAGCPLIGKQCPIKADKIIDYDGDYGWTEEAVYEVSEVRKADVEDSGAKAMAEALELAKEKKANERADMLKKHYKGKLLQVSKANGSCESMDECMDQMENHTIRWIEFTIEKGDNEADADKKKEVANFMDAINELKLKVLDFGQRSGMQMSGARKAGGDSADIRSSIEASLAEEVLECTKEFFSFMRDRMKEIDIRDTRVTKTIEMLEGMLNELHGRNLAVFEKLEMKRMDRSRKLKKNSDLRREVEEKNKPEEEEASADDATPAGGAGPPPGAPGRGGMLDAIAGRGRGGGRGGLLDDISGRKGRGGGGRGGLLDQIAGRKGRGDQGGGGRGGLLGEISGRGRGGRGGGGRGGLLDAIAGRGRGGNGDGRGGGGRGGLLAAIAARGGGD